MMKVSCHSCLSWKECAQTKVKLAQAQYIKSRTYTAHFWTEFAINEIIQVLEASQFFVHMGKGLTHHRLQNHITRNIFTTTTFEHHSKIIKILRTEEHLPSFLQQRSSTLYRR